MVADLVGEPSLLVALVRLVDRISVPPPRPRAPGPPGGVPRPPFLKALVVMAVKRLPRVGTLLAVLAEPTPEMRHLRALRAAGAGRALTLVTPRRGPYPHTDGGVEVQRVFHRLRSRAIETWNGQFKSIFDCTDRVPTPGPGDHPALRAGRGARLPTGPPPPPGPRRRPARRLRANDRAAPNVKLPLLHAPPDLLLAASAIPL